MSHYKHCGHRLMPIEKEKKYCFNCEKSITDEKIEDFRIPSVSRRK